MLRRTVAGAVTLASAVMGLGAVSGGASAAGDGRAPLIASEGQGIAGQYVVMLREGASKATVTAAADRARGQGARVRHVFSAIHGYSASMTQRELAAVRSDPAVAYVEQDQVMRGVGTQTDATWGLDRVAQRDLPLSGSYRYSATGLGVSTYVIDSGLNAAHHEFTGRVGKGYTAIHDGRGTGDCNGHGTHVAGTLAGTAYGVAKRATVVPVRVLDCQGAGSTAGVVAGMDWVAGRSTASPRVANLSLGGPPSRAMDDAVARLVAAGVAVAVAAGNENQDACKVSPARAAAAITVGSSTRKDARSPFSNWGSCVDLFAPGSSITSAWIGSATATSTIFGTSMASPHVAGAAALHLEENPSATPATVASVLLASATANKISDPMESPNRLLFTNPATSAVTSATRPRRVAKPTVKVDGRKAVIRWTTPRDGGSPLTGYRVNVSGTVRTTGPGVRRLVLRKLARGRYQVRVRAVNAIGVGPASERTRFRIRAR